MSLSWRSIVYSVGMAAPVTPLLFIDTDIPLDIEHERPQSEEEAIQYIRSGITVVVPDADTARNVLLFMGLNPDYVEGRIDIALHGPSHGRKGDPDAPVPRAPGALLP
jgi:hypothetical protein